MSIFSTSDLVELFLGALLLIFAIVARPFIEPFARGLSAKTRWCMLFLALLPIGLRIAMLANHPVPSPQVYDEFGHLLVADTLLHFRLANPPHPLHQFFETFFVLQTPSYASVYPLGQGLMLALGKLLFGSAWAGILLSTAAFCALCYWMLLAWTTPAWALLGGVLSIIEFGPLNPWMNSYWGGGVSACAGCLVFGSLPRLRESYRARDAALLGLGLALQLLTRPYESMFLALSVLLFLRPARLLGKAAVIAALSVAPAIGLMLLQNRQVSGDWTTLPSTLSRYQYGVPASFTWHVAPTPHLELTRDQQLLYKAQTSFSTSGPETVTSYLQRLEFRVRFYRFFFFHLCTSRSRSSSRACASGVTSGLRSPSRSSPWASTSIRSSSLIISPR